MHVEVHSPGAANVQVLGAMAIPGEFYEQQHHEQMPDRGRYSMPRYKTDEEKTSSVFMCSYVRCNLHENYSVFFAAAIALPMYSPYSPIRGSREGWMSWGFSS